MEEEVISDNKSNTDSNHGSNMVLNPFPSYNNNGLNQNQQSKMISYGISARAANSLPMRVAEENYQMINHPDHDNDTNGSRLSPVYDRQFMDPQPNNFVVNPYIQQNVPQPLPQNSKMNESTKMIIDNISNNTNIENVSADEETLKNFTQIHNKLIDEI